MKWTEVTVLTTTQASEMISAILEQAGSKGVMIEDKNDVYANQRPEGQWDIIDEAIAERIGDDVRVTGYYPVDEHLENAMAAIREGLAGLRAQELPFDLGKLEVLTHTVDEEDWAESWKKDFTPIRLGEHMVVKPSWCDYEAQAGDHIIELDPGMAFGTGTHETTGMCVRLVEEHVRPGQKVIDLGTGTGILAIAAAHMGARDVLAIDLDAVAVRVAKENVENNGFAGIIRVQQGDLLDHGDEILVPDPCFPNYYGQANIVGATAVPVPTYEKFDYRIQAADIESAITPRTKAMILNSPCNPTGAVLTKEDVLEIAEVAKKHDLWVLSDEPYDSIVYDGITPYSIAEAPGMRDRVMVLNSFSKAYAMTGWRIGYLLAPEPEYITKMAQLQEAVASCVSTFSQVAAVEALKSRSCVDQMVADYTRRRDILIDGINSIPGFSCRKPAGSFYAFVNIKAFGKSSQEFAEELVEHARVVTVPGSAFGEMGEGHLRLVFANSDENLKEAVRRIDEYVRKAYPDMK